MYTKSLGLTLTLAIALITLGYANPSFADKANSGNCGNKHCNHGGGGGGDVLGNFTVTVYLEVGTTFMDVGSAVNVVGDSESDDGHHRAGIGATDMIGFNLDALETAQLDTPQPGCPSSLGASINGRFGISTARHEENGPITFVEVAFHNFTANDGVSYWVSFANATLSAEDLFNWLPVPGPDSKVTWMGDAVSLAVTKGPTKKGPCNGVIEQRWKVVVLNELVV